MNIQLYEFKLTLVFDLKGTFYKMIAAKYAVEL